jgi:hypothetical protein
MIALLTGKFSRASRLLAPVPPLPGPSFDLLRGGKSATGAAALRDAGRVLMLVSIPGAAYAGSLEDAEEAVRKSDYATAIPIYRSLAEKGDVSAQMRLGFFYEAGAPKTE